MNPAVMEPSHIPRISRTTNRPAKFVHAAWHIKATAQVKMFILQFRCQAANQKRKLQVMVRTSSICPQEIAAKPSFEAKEKSEPSNVHWNRGNGLTYSKTKYDR